LKERIDENRYKQQKAALKKIQNIKLKKGGNWKIGDMAI